MVFSFGLRFISYLLRGYTLIIMDCIYMNLNSYEQYV